ncbi:hypothetical protein ACS0TY_033447 [Phlomoides rotata]
MAQRNLKSKSKRTQLNCNIPEQNSSGQLRTLYKLLVHVSTANYPSSTARSRTIFLIMKPYNAPLADEAFFSDSVAPRATFLTNGRLVSREQQGDEPSIFESHPLSNLQEIKWLAKAHFAERPTSEKERRERERVRRDLVEIHLCLEARDSTAVCILDKMIFGLSYQAIISINRMFRSGLQHETNGVNGNDIGKFCGQGVALLEDCVQKMYQNSGARTRMIDYIGHLSASPQQSGEDGDISFHAFNDNAVLHQVGHLVLENSDYIRAISMELEILGWHRQSPPNFNSPLFEAAEKPKPPNTRLVSFQMKQSCTRRISNAINALDEENMDSDGKAI